MREAITETFYGKVRSVVPVADISHFEASEKLVTAFHPNGQMLLDESLDSIEAEMGGKFIRTHRSVLARGDAIECVRRVIGTDRYEAVLRGVDEPVRVSRRIVAKVRSQLSVPT